MKKNMRNRCRYLCLCLWLGASALYTFCQWKELNRFWNQAGIRCENGGVTAAQVKELEQENPEEVTAWSRAGSREVWWKEMEKSAAADVVKVYGNMARVLPFSMKCGGYTFPEDKEGCIISSGLAWSLFQTDQAVGNVVFFEEKDWVIRGIVDAKDPILAVWQQDETKIMPYVELYAQNGEPPAANMETIKSSLGIYQEAYLFAGSFYCSVVRICLFLPFWCVFGYLCVRVRKRKAGKVERIAVRAGLVLVFAAGVWGSICFTADFIPANWSDFDFWAVKIQDIAAGIRQRGRMEEVYWERQVLALSGRAAAGTLAILGGIAGIGILHSREISKDAAVESQKIILEKRKSLWYSFKRQ